MIFDFRYYKDASIFMLRSRIYRIPNVRISFDELDLDKGYYVIIENIYWKEVLKAFIILENNVE